MYSTYTGWPKKNATLTINNFKKTRDRMKKLCSLHKNYLKSHNLHTEDFPLFALAL